MTRLDGQFKEGRKKNISCDHNNYSTKKANEKKKKKTERTFKLEVAYQTYEFYFTHLFNIDTTAVWQMRALQVLQGQKQYAN